MKPVQDTIEFNLSADTTVINDTVKITAMIVGIVTPELTEAMLKERIKGMMKSFITDANWQFSNMSRNSHRSGMEEITLQATARVSETENYALDRRSREVSVEGMTINAVNTDTSPPAYMIEAAENKLRVVLLDKAKKQLEAINEHLGAEYRLGEVVFGDTNDPANPKMAKMAMQQFATANYYSGMVGSAGAGGADPDTIGNAVKLTMAASVTLKQYMTLTE